MGGKIFNSSEGDRKLQTLVFMGSEPDRVLQTNRSA